MKKTVFIVCGALSQLASAGVFQSLGHLPSVPSGNYSAADISDGGLTITVTANGVPAKWTFANGLQQLPVPADAGPLARCDSVSSDGSLITGATSSSTNGMLIYPTVWSVTNVQRADDGVGQGFVFIDSAGRSIAGTANDPTRGQPTGYTEVLGSRARQYLGTPVNTPDINPTSIVGGLSNDAAVVIGSAQVQVPDSSPPFIRSVPFRWTASTGMVALLNNGQRVYGTATDITPSGSMIVGSNFDTSQLFRWTEADGYQFFSLAPGTSLTSVAKISADGGTITAGLSVWTTTRGVRSLQSVLTEAGCNFTGWTLEAVTGVSGDGLTLCGNGIDPQGLSQAWVATIPAPAGLVLTVAGMAAVVRRRRP